MTSTELLIYNCFIIPLCSPDNNGVAGVFLIIWQFFFFFYSLSRTSGNCGENNDCLPRPARPPASSSVSHGLHITNSLSATRSLIKEAAGLPFKADSIYTASHQRPSGSSVSNEQLVFECLTQGLWQITISSCFFFLSFFPRIVVVQHFFSVQFEVMWTSQSCSTTHTSTRKVFLNYLEHKWIIRTCIKSSSLTHTRRIWCATATITSLIMLSVWCDFIQRWGD